MFCSKCGQPLPDGATFCSKCGTVQGSTQAAPQSTQAQAPNINVNINNQFPPAPKKKVNKATYILLAIFLGGFGVHKFVEGKIGWGIIYILLFVIGWATVAFLIGVLPLLAYLVLLIIDIIKAASKPADANGFIEL